MVCSFRTSFSIFSCVVSLLYISDSDNNSIRVVAFRGSGALLDVRLLVCLTHGIADSTLPPPLRDQLEEALTPMPRSPSQPPTPEPMTPRSVQADDTLASPRVARRRAEFDEPPLVIDDGALVCRCVSQCSNDGITDGVYSALHRESMLGLMKRVQSAYREVNSVSLKAITRYSYAPYPMDQLLDAVCIALDIPRPESWNGLSFVSLRMLKDRMQMRKRSC